MRDDVVVGSVLIAGAWCPETLFPDSVQYVQDWVLLDRSQDSALDATLEASGWHSFFIAGRLSATTLGFHRETGVRRAVRRLVSSVGARRFNSLQIAAVVAKRFLGVYRVTVTGYSRHMQQGNVLLRGRPKGSAGLTLNRDTQSETALPNRGNTIPELGRWETEGGAMAAGANPA